MKRHHITPLLVATGISLLTGCASINHPTAAMPHLEKQDGMTKLIVDGHPYICIGGELHNSSSTDAAWMAETMPRLARANFNTVLSVVSWDLIEPAEGVFDFSMIDDQLRLARENNLHLILLWMGSWKNGMSQYVPDWVKADQHRFPRVVNADGNSLEILSTFSTNSRNADARAFVAVMRHLRTVDSTDHTVIAMQVENEVGILGSSRDFSLTATASYKSAVPTSLTAYLDHHKTTLRHELKKLWDAQSDRTTGTWEHLFGKNTPRPDPPVPNSPNRTLRPADFKLTCHTDELFMAWNYANYIGYVAAQGKKEYPLPMYVNTWIVQPMDRGPGDYPSGGPEPLVHDIWHAGAPAIDILAPDIYTDNFAEVLTTFAQNGNPAFNPEGRANANNCWKAVAELNALCYSPFGIDSVSPDGAFANSYRLINGLSGAIAQAQGKPDAIKLLALKDGENPGKIDIGDYTFDFTAASIPHLNIANGPNEKDAVGLDFLNAPYIVIVHTAPNEFYFATNGQFPFRISPRIPNGNIASAATIDRGTFVNGKWTPTYRFNGDDLMGLGYDISGASAKRQTGTQVPLGIAVGSRPAHDPSTPEIIRVRLYQYR